MPAPNPGPPPEMPPHGSSDPNSPDYNPERAEWEDRVGEDEARRIKQAWQAWAAAEDHYISDQITYEGKNIDEIENPWGGGEKYQDVRGKGAVAYQRYLPLQEEMHRQGLERLKAAGHFSWDPTIGAYRSGGGGPGGNAEDFRDAFGRRISAPAGSSRAVSMTTGIGPFTPGNPTQSQTSSRPNPNDRPFLKQPSTGYYRGYGSLWQASTSPAARRPVSSNDPYSELRIGGVADTADTDNLFRRQQYYIPGLSRSQ